jgi:hypothetical protein
MANLRADRDAWVEPMAALPAASLRGRPALRQLARAVDGAARRHPGAVLATVFAGGMAAGAWLGGSRLRGLADDSGERAAPLPPGDELAPARSIPTGRRVTLPPLSARPRNPVGSYSTIQG